MTSSSHKTKGLPRLGILGGGQLARMLVCSAHRQGIPTVVISPQSEDPAAQVTSEHKVCSLDDEEGLKKILIQAQIEVLTFESELIPHPVLRMLEELHESNTLHVFPHPHLMSSFSHRLKQKNLLIQYKLPTAPFLPLSSELSAHGARLMAYLKEHEPRKTQHSGWVLKCCTGGYDGRGTFFLKPTTTAAQLSDFLQRCPGSLVAEHTIDFARELAFSAVRSTSGALQLLPLVETHQHRGQCDWVRGPVVLPQPHQNPDSTHRPTRVHFKKLAEQVKTFLEDLDYEGLITFELFELPGSCELMINEIAPRVHNSAHYSLDALSYSQFDLHLQSFYVPHLTSWQLLSKGFAMANLLGTGRQCYHCTEQEGVRLHWYGKKENRMQRKMAHLNALAPTAEQALSRVLDVRQKMWLP